MKDYISTGAAAGNLNIPEEAEKPFDAPAGIPNAKSRPFHFPLLTCGPFMEESFLQDLSDDERQLLEGQRACEACAFDRAAAILEELAQTTQDLYVKIGIHFTNCFIDIFANRPQEFQSNLSALRSIFEGEFQYKEDMRTIFADIESMYLGNRVFDRCKIDPQYSYAPDVLPYIYEQCTYRDCIKAVAQRTPISLENCMIACENFMMNGRYLVAQRLHMYMAIGYCSTPDTIPNALQHLKIAIDLGVKHESYMALAIFYYSMKVLFHEALKGFDPVVSDRIIQYGMTLENNIASFLGDASEYMAAMRDLTEFDKQLMVYAVRGYSNKTIAGLTNLPARTIRYRYKELTAKYGAADLKQLADVYIQILTDGYK